MTYKISEKMAVEGITQKMLDDYAAGEELVARSDALSHQAQFKPETYNFDDGEYERLMEEAQQLRNQGFDLMEAYHAIMIAEASSFDK